MSSDFGNFNEYLGFVLEQCKVIPQQLGVAIAGPVCNDKIDYFMNIKWPGFSIDEI